MNFTPKVQRAIGVAAEKHLGQVRKGDGLPYITHPYSVAVILTNFTEDENIIVAGLLHDLLEDVEGYGYEGLKNDFGEFVANIVKEVSEEKDPCGTKEKKEASWEARKKNYLEHLEFVSYEAMMVCAADKLHNIFSMYAAYRKQGNSLWQKFNAPVDKIAWFYEEAIKILQRRLKNIIVDALVDIYFGFKGEMFEEIKPVYSPAEKETFEDIVFKTCFPLNLEISPGYNELQEKANVADFSLPFIAFILDGFKPYKIYLVNPTDKNYIKVESLTGAFFSTGDRLVSTTIVSKHLRHLPPKSFILVEEDDFDQLDYQIWFHLDLYPEDDFQKPEMVQFDMPRYGLGYKEKATDLPVINTKGMYISFLSRHNGEIIEEEMKHMNIKGGYMD